ncbi:MAG: cytochrome b N-terminal domain-containing protein [Geobacteraceae bacterium]|nr:cytochrome b N-terminal domain-containing protein [Geobacteraceae bacterium]
MFNRLMSRIDERWPLTALTKLALEEEITGGANYAYTLGSAIISVFLTQAITGVWQLFYYVPTVNYAYDSLNYIRTEVPFGWLIHNLHYWGANAMVVLVVLHMCRVYIWGSYKNPRELTWLAGVLLFLLTMALMFTGACLTWDELGYWASQVGTSIAGTVPIIGEFIKKLMRGGETMGQLTLSRFFILHIAILPFLLAAMIGIHLVAFRKFGETGPWNESKRHRTGMFWPDQLFMDTIVFMAIFVLMVALCVFSPPPVNGPADPMDTTYLPKPEWNFLFLYQALKYFKGAFEPVGTVGLPLVGILLLLLTPFIDRNSEHNPLRRPVVMTVGLLAVATTVALSIIGYYSHPGAVQAPSVAPKAQGVVVSTVTESVRRGEQLFKSLGCSGCHMVNGAGGKIGPDLSGEANNGRSRQWLEAQIRDPKSHDFATVMPAFNTLKKQQLDDLSDYLLSLKSAASAPKGYTVAPTPRVHPVNPTERSNRPESSVIPARAVYTIGSAEHGRVLFEQYCSSCHGFRGTDDVPNPGSAASRVPALNPVDRALFSGRAVDFAVAIDRFIQHGSRPAGRAPALVMQAFGDSGTLSQQEIADIEAYILSLNGVDRAELLHPGIEPRRFFIFVLAAFILAGIALTALWKRHSVKNN